MSTFARLLIPDTPLLDLPPKPGGFAALDAEDREWREDHLAERVEALLRTTRFGEAFVRGDAERPVHVGVGWTEGAEASSLVIEFEGAISIPMIDLVARELSLSSEVRVRGVTMVGGDASPLSVRSSVSSRWKRGEEVARRDTRDTAWSRVERRFGGSTGISAEAVAEWLLEDDSVSVVDSLNWRPCHSARVQPLVERILAGARASWTRLGGIDALRLEDDTGAQTTTLSDTERAELTRWVAPPPSE